MFNQKCFFIEAKVNQSLNKATNIVGKAVKISLKKMNNIKQMVDAGSKGNAMNINFHRLLLVSDNRTLV